MEIILAYLTVMAVGGLGFTFLIPHPHPHEGRRKPNTRIGPIRLHVETDFHQWNWPYAIPAFFTGCAVGWFLLFCLRAITCGLISGWEGVLIALLLIFPIESFAWFMSED